MPCSIDGCARPARTKGFCSTHYMRLRRNGDPLASKPRSTRSLAERLWEKVEMPDDACWRWQGAVDKDGYGLIYVKPRRIIARVHRVVYESEVGPIPEGAEIDHLCGVANCVNPVHLEPVTPAENLRREWVGRKGARNS